MSKKTDLIIIATAKAQLGKEKELEKALLNVAKPTREQPGCVSFSLYRSTENPGMIVGLERWESSEAHDTHLKGAHVAKLMSEMGPVLAETPSIISYEIIDE